MDVVRAQQGMVFYIKDYEYPNISKHNAEKLDKSGNLIKDNKFNCSDIVEVIPLTHSKPEYNPCLYEKIITDNRVSYALINQAKTVNVFELGTYKFSLLEKTLKSILKKRAIYLGYIKPDEEYENNQYIEKSLEEDEINQDSTNELEYDDNFKNIVDKFEMGEGKKILNEYPGFTDYTDLYNKVMIWYKTNNIEPPKFIVTDEKEFLKFYKDNGLTKTLKEYNITPRFKQSVYNKVSYLKRKYAKTI